MMRDPQAAADAFARAAAAGYLPARYRLGLLRRDGAGVPADWYGAAFDLYAACAELTGYRPPDTDINAPQAQGTAVRPVEPRPIRAQGKARRVVSMRKMREDRLGRLLFGSGDARPAVAPATPAQRAAEDGERRRRIRDCMARNRRRRVGIADSQRLDAALSAGVMPHSGDGWSDWDPSAAAYALGRMLESGCRAANCQPMPLHALHWYRPHRRRSTAQPSRLQPYWTVGPRTPRPQGRVQPWRPHCDNAPRRSTASSRPRSSRPCWPCRPRHRSARPS